MARLSVRVTPRAGADEVVGVAGEEVLVRVRPAPADGKANAATCAAVARFLSVPKTRVTVVRGGASRHKVLEVEGVDEAELRRALDAAFPA